MNCIKEEKVQANKLCIKEEVANELHYQKEEASNELHH